MKGLIKALSIVTIVGFVLACPAAAEVYDYNFNSLTAGYLNGQDNWTTTGSLEVQTTTGGGRAGPVDGLCVTNYGGTAAWTATHPNDSNWSYDLTATAELANHFALQYSIVIDYTLSAYYGHSKYYIKDAATGDSIGFGINVEQWYYGLAIWDAQGTKHLGGQPRPGYNQLGQVWDFRLVVDTAANGGEGAGYFYSMMYGTHTEWQPVENLQGINLKLLTAGYDVFSSDQIIHNLKTRITGADNFQVITPMRGDANLDELVDGVDFTYLKANFGQTGKTWSDADFNGDGLVDGQDFTYLKANFGQNQQYTVTRPTTAPVVPEPATMLILAGGGLGLLRRRRR